MATAAIDSPYPVGTLVRDPAMLALRRREIDKGLSVVAPAEGGEHRHAVLIGEPHSGRSSVLAEISRRASDERCRLIVRLRGGDGVGVGRGELARHLLTSVAETLSEEAGTQAGWYRAWRDRVYLRNTAAAGPDDLLSSALVLAADASAEIDHAILERDLGAFADLARSAGYEGIVVCVDDASPLTEDVNLTEEIVEVFDSVGDFSLLLTGLPSIPGHFTEAASRCLERVEPVFLEPFWNPAQMMRALRAPLPSDAEYLRNVDIDFIFDLLNLTGGNPYELMVVADNLWLSCVSGEKDSYALTPRLLDRVIPHLALRTGESDALHDGAEAIDSLPDEKVHTALELASLSQLTIREVATYRLLSDSSGKVASDRSPNDITDHLDETEDSVRADLLDLEAKGVLATNPDGENFAIVGGRPAAVLLKYKAQARIEETRDPGFGQNFLQLAGVPLVHGLITKAEDVLPGVVSLGFSIIGSDRGLGGRSPRPALRSLTESGEFTRLLRSEVQILPYDAEKEDRLEELVASDDARLALVCASVSHGSGEMEFMELWEVPEQIIHARLSEALGEAVEGCRPVIDAAGLSWRGIDSAVVSDVAARNTIVVLRPNISVRVVHSLFREWREGSDSDGLDRAIRATEESIEVMRTGGDSDLELGGELSASLSRLGFLRSLEDDGVEQARAALEEAQRTGEADGWVTEWNLANLLARANDTDGALARLDQLSESFKEQKGVATLVFHLPGRPLAECLIDVEKRGVLPLIALQRAVLEDDSAARSLAIGVARETKDPGATLAAEWVEALDAQLALQTSDSLGG
jgi:hypothetical protein